VLIVNGKLVVFDPQAQDIKGSLLTLTPTGPNMFKISGKDGGAEVGETLVFELAPDGKVTRMKVGANYRYPVR
jgi:hypothetical protein